MAEDYQPLANELERQSTSTVTLTLAEIEAIIGVLLPPRARQRGWWVGGQPRVTPRQHVREAGWRIVLDGFWGRTPVVTFVRSDRGGMGEGLP